MNMLLCQFCWTEVFPDFWWGLVVMVTILGSLWKVCPIIKGHIDSKSTLLDIQFKHEEKMKDDAHKREIEWYSIKRAELPIDDLEKELKECKNKLKGIQDKEEELKKGTESLKNEKEQFEKKVLQAKIEIYEEIIKTINK